MASNWIQKARVKKGALRAQLAMPKGKNIPRSLLRKIKGSRVGTTITNPTTIGKRRIKVTELLKRRVQFALNV